VDKPTKNRRPTEFEVPTPDPNTRAMDQGEVAKAHGVSRERIRQIEQLALRKLRHYLRSRGLDKTDFL
jgi:DNA-directed RNA polymerase sigma subunit (sigma70/sigma32)